MSGLKYILLLLLLSGCDSYLKQKFDMCIQYCNQHKTVIKVFEAGNADGMICECAFNCKSGQ